MNEQEWSEIRHHRRLNLSLLQAYYAVHAYPRHNHDYYVISVVDRGLQSFLCGGDKHVTPPDGLILLNPADAHTGEPMGEEGFAYRAIYPTVEHMAAACYELTGRRDAMPYFQSPRADDPQLAHALRRLHSALQRDAASSTETLECESRLLWLLVQLIERYGNQQVAALRPGREDRAIQQACDYMQAHYREGVSLSDLTTATNLSRYHLLRTFRDAIGMPPHAYQESLRIRHAQQLLAEAKPLAEVAYAVGYSSQAHFTQRFKQIIGVTPGKYVQ